MTSALNDIRSLDPAESSAGLVPEDEDVLAALFENWDRYAEIGTMLRPISPLAISLLRLDPESPTPLRDLAKIIESDPILAARMLGLANSVVFAGSSKPVFKIGDAITRLGADTVLTAAFAQLAAQWLRGVSRTTDASLLHDLWFEYLVTAHSSREIARRLPDDQVEPALAYAAGLLHDIGTIALICAQPEPMSRFVRSGYGFGGPLYPRFVRAHTLLGAAILHRWRTPGEIAVVAACHHEQPLLSGALAVTVFLADHLHLAVLDHDRALFENPGTLVQGCFNPAGERLDAALATLDVADQMESIVGRVAADCQAIELLAKAIRL